MAKDYGWRFRRKGVVVGRNGDSAKVWTPEEYQRLMDLSHVEGAARIARDRFVSAARDGDRVARLQLIRDLGCRVYTRKEIEAEEARRFSRQGARSAKGE